MITATISEFRKDIKKYFSRVTDEFETLFIDLGKDSSVVVLSQDEYSSLMTTQREMSSRKNKSRLDSAIEKF